MPAAEPARRVLLAPVTVTPTKPLTPSHLKGLLWTDVMFRATGRVAEVTYRCSPTTYHPTEQTVGFWEHLDRTVGDVDWSERSEEDIGELYVGFRGCGERPTVDACRPYLDAVEQGWVHPASARVLELWAQSYGRLGMHDPGLTEHQPPGMELAEAIDRVAAVGMILDTRPDGGPVYLDATADGIPLRRLVSEEGRPNYLACALRELVPLCADSRYDDVVLLHDPELEQDYLVLQRVLGRLGVRAHRVPVGRVPIEGKVRSARHGDWRGHTAGALLEAIGDDWEDPVVRLGTRLYFIAMLGPGDQTSFRPALLRRSLQRAAKLLAAPGRGGDARAYLDEQVGADGYVDPYRLTSQLLARRTRAPVQALAAEVFT
jgi:hypothetical protein